VTANVALVDRLLSVAELQAAVGIATSPGGRRHTPTTRAVAAAGGQPGLSVPVIVPWSGRGRWIVVFAAHNGAGASTVALALADAAASDGTAARLIARATPEESGLTEASLEVLGLEPTGHWFRGRRGTVTIDLATPTAASVQPSDDTAHAVTIVDAGPVAIAGMDPAPAVTAVVVVCRPTAPGMRRAEEVLGRVSAPALLAVVGPRKWPAVVTASLGPTAAGLRAAGRLVAVPIDPHLAAAGLTADPLPRRVLGAARAVLDLIPASAAPTAINRGARTPRANLP
jgi:hypothetical protein